MATAQLRFSAADRREQILDIATRLFARQGYQGTTTKQISQHAHVNEALIFRHFPTKDELYWAVIQRKIESVSPRERMQEELDPEGDDQQVFTHLAAEILKRRAEDQTLSRMLLFSALENHKLSQRFFRTYVSGYYELLAEFIRRRIAQGRFRNVDPLLAARGFLGMVIYHSWVQELFGGKRYQKFDVQQVSETLAEIWLQGMLASPKGNSPLNSANSQNGDRRNHRSKQKHVSRIQNS
ncbi:MAG TPA: TetR/AcrR family transcriptional regulator [Terriglobales bacterium]|nr:TetR/AcrR family transcriptional regulator [Terriglobales bacterium]